MKQQNKINWSYISGLTATEFKQFMKSKFAYSNLRGMTYDGLYEFVDANYQ